MMKVAVVISYSEPFEIKQLPIPQLGPMDVLVDNIACGIQITTIGGGVQAAIATVPLIEVYDETFKSVRRDGYVIVVALPNAKMS
ncbi:unnamed protein product [Rotaria sp. Silwood2]|nr:unnamed protein product [Rotaria sp. Silwood2]CAF3355521.1 unnamed protein product [Rotaria sp. Silwood2]CAF3952322.1 unnamed protein product [Rotaria sp. Silwood2]CAF4157460.1 unnamed protein product [Rotaria sp. Silwood2]